MDGEVQLYRGILLIFALLAAACDGEPPLDLMPTPNNMAEMLDTGVVEAPADLGVTDLNVPVSDDLCPDEAAFEEVVAQQIDNVCGACHNVRHDPANRLFEWYSYSLGELSTAQQRDNFVEALRLIDFDAPERSTLFTYHRDKDDSHGVFTAAREDLVTEWIQASTQNCVAETESDAGVVRPGAESPCPSNVNADRFGTPESRAQWAAPGGVHEVLVGTGPANPGKCADPACHGTSGTGGNLWFQSADMPDAANCNLSVIEGWINRLDVDSSEILTEPLGEMPDRPGQSQHGGAVVFRGRDDPAYILLRNWIIEGGIQ